VRHVCDGSRRGRQSSRDHGREHTCPSTRTALCFGRSGTDGRLRGGVRGSRWASPPGTTRSLTASRSDESCRQCGISECLETASPTADLHPADCRCFPGILPMTQLTTISLARARHRSTRDLGTIRACRRNEVADVIATRKVGRESASLQLWRGSATQRASSWA
jgi:hypothetical protein